MNTNTIKTHLFLLTFLPFALGIQAQSSRNYVSATERHDGGGTLTTYQYYDEAGRPSGTVQVGVTPDGSNLMDMTEYDGFGRKTRQWLPRSSASANLNASDFTLSPQSAYGDSRPFTETAYEASPVGRPLSETGPGHLWQDHPVTTAYLTNTSSFPLSCKDYYVSVGGDLNDKGFYREGTLHVTGITDEDGNATYEFRDTQDRLLLRRRMLSTSDCADTYYAYDICGDLRYVLQPEYQRDNDLARLAFQYAYDRRHNVTMKKMPGAAPVLMAYDRANHLIFSQDGNQRSRGRMSFFLYDNIGRVVVQGQCDGTGLPDIGNTAVTASFSHEGGICGTGYSASIPLTNAQVEQAHYYDTYYFLTLPLFSQSGLTAGDVSARGLETGSAVAVLYGDTLASDTLPSMLLSASHYDIKGRQTLLQTTNILGGTDIACTEYGYLLPARTTCTHTSAGHSPMATEQTYTYDHADRLTSSSLKLNGGETMMLHADSYDDYGRLSTKRLMDSETVSYAYNIRSWLTFLQSDNFSEEISYNQGTNRPSYSGNIARMEWMAGQDSDWRGYRFEYDAMSRLVKASYGEGQAGFTNRDRYTTQYSYDLNGNMTTLKRNGLLEDSCYGPIDDVAITYDGNRMLRAGDAADAPLYAGAWHFRDGADAVEEYEYDENGNMTKDLNSNISSISYNFLNLPSRIEFMDGSTTRYTYDATGRKLRAEYLKAGTQDTLRTDYCGNLIYEQGRPKMLLVDGGYITFNDNANGNVNDSLQWHYYLTDHLGNNRVVVGENDSIEQVNHYYPYGGLMAESTGSDTQRYKYNGKELDRMHGLDWYDYGARWMNGLTFTTPDPKAWDYTDVSPYVYCMNNPIKFIDPDGRDSYLIVWATQPNAYGHAAFAIDNYSWDANQDKFVPDGSMTVYGLFPKNTYSAEQAAGDERTQALFLIDKHATLSEIIDNSFNSGEEYNPDGILRISTTYEMDNKTKDTLQKEIESNKGYKGMTRNCSTFAREGVRAATGKEVKGEENFLWNNYVTPNSLFKETQTLKSTTTIINPGQKIEYKFSTNIKRLFKERAIKK